MFVPAPKPGSRSTRAYLQSEAHNSGADSQSDELLSADAKVMGEVLIVAFSGTRHSVFPTRSSTATK